MTFTGTVFQYESSSVADITVDETENYIWINIRVGENVVVKFPLAKGADRNEIELRIRNVVNQTGIIKNSCEVVLTPVI